MQIQSETIKYSISSQNNQQFCTIENPNQIKQTIHQNKNQSIISPNPKKRSKTQLYCINSKQPQCINKLQQIKALSFSHPQVFLRYKPCQNTPQRKNSIKNKSKSLSSSKTINPQNNNNEKEQNPKNQQQINEMKRFPHFICKSNQMVCMKQKLLQMKHNIKFNQSLPNIQSIHDSINVNRASYTRKMKVQVCKKGNTSLNKNFQKDLKHFLCQDSPQKCQQEHKHYRPIDLPYLKAIHQQRYENQFDKCQRSQKLEQIKRKLKSVRKTNFHKVK